MVKNINTITIGETTYNDKSVLTSVNLKNVPWSNNSMDNAFWNCQNLTSVTNINQNVTSMSGTFSQCHNLVNVPAIPNSVTDMWAAFQSCNNLIDAPEIPNSVTSLWSTFEGCDNLVNAPAVIPNSVTAMGYAFAYCENIANAPDFSNCNALTSISSAFRYCWGINSICNIPNSVTNMGSAFQGCTNLVSIGSISDSAKDMSLAFFDCSNLSSNIVIPNTTTSLCETFNNCSNLSNISNVPNVTYTLMNTFQNCTSLVNAPEIGSAVEDMRGTFYGCVNLTGDINIHSTNIANVINCFGNTSETKNVYIPFNYFRNTTITYKAFVNTDVNKVWYVTANISDGSGPTYVLYDENMNLVSNGEYFVPYGTEYGDMFYITEQGWGSWRGLTHDNSQDVSVTHYTNEHTATYNAFVEAGYDTVNVVDGVLLKELAAPQFEPGPYTADSGLTENNLVYSNFANTTGIQIPSTYGALGNEIICKFRFTKAWDSEASGDKFLFGQDSLDIYISEGNVVNFYTRNGPVTILTPELNTWYWIKIFILGSNYIDILTSTDGENWTSLGAKSYWGTINDRPIVLGAKNSSSTESPFPGEIDMSAFRVYNSTGVSIWGTDPYEPTSPILYDKVNNKATVVGYFTNGEGQKYAVCVADGIYRSSYLRWSSASEDTPLTGYATAEAALLSTDSATENMNVISSNYSLSTYEAFNASNNQSLTYRGTTYNGVLPNAKELKMIYDNRTLLDNADITIINNSSYSLSNWNMGGNSNYACWSSNEADPFNYAYALDSSGNWKSLGQDSYKKWNYYGVIPVFEIPVDD